MSGASLPTGFSLPGFTGGQTFGMTGGQANFNPTTTAAVSDNKGGLQAYDPSTMHETRAPGPVAETIAPPAGYGTSGLPDWQTNWLQNGGTTPYPVLGGSGDNATGPLTAKVDLSNPAPPVARPAPVKTPAAPVKTPAAAAPASTFVKPKQGPAPVFKPTLAPVAGGSTVTMDMLDRTSDAGIKAILAGDFGHPDLQFAGAARFVVPDEAFYKYATWRLGTAGLAGPSAATQDPYRLARNQPDAQLDANGRPYLNPGYASSGYGGSNSS